MTKRGNFIKDGDVDVEYAASFVGVGDNHRGRRERGGHIDRRVVPVVDQIHHIRRIGRR